MGRLRREKNYGRSARLRPSQDQIQIQESGLPCRCARQPQWHRDGVPVREPALPLLLARERVGPLVAAARR